MRDRIAKLLIAAAAVLLLGDLLWIAPRLAPYIWDLVRRSPEAALLAGAFLLLVAARAVRAPRRSRPQATAPGPGSLRDEGEESRGYPRRA